MDNPAGYKLAEYINTGQYLDHKMGGSHLTYIQTANVLHRHHQRIKRNPLLVAGMAATAVAQIAGLIKTFQLQGEVPELAMNLKAMDIRLEANALMTTDVLRSLTWLVKL